MSQNSVNHDSLSAILNKQESTLLSDWIKEQSSVQGRQGAVLKESELRSQCSEFIELLRTSLEQGKEADIESAPWKGVREMLEHLSQSRVAAGFSPSETASFIFSLKRPIFASLRRELGGRSPGSRRRDLVDAPSCSTSWASTRPRSTRPCARRSSAASSRR